MKDPLPPLVRTTSVSWDPERAFHRFTAEFEQWWPWRSHSIGGARVRRLVFECRAGGLIFEEHRDGRRFQWGQVLEWEPPRRIKFSWHPSREPASAQEVELRFHPEGSGTRLELVATHWENWGAGAKRARRGYGLGWSYVLEVWAGRRTLGRMALDGLAMVLGLVQRLRGGQAAVIARSGGELHPAGLARDLTR